MNRAVERLTKVFESGLLFATTIDARGPELSSALEDLEAAQSGLGSNREPTFWSAVLLAKAGNIDAARTQLAFAAETNQRWNLFLRSLADAGVLPVDNALLNGR